MRGILTDWLIQVHMHFCLLKTLYLAVIMCVFLAAKVEEIMAPSTVNFLNNKIYLFTAMQSRQIL
ncbi:hypothetical protein EI94DRAFT_1905346, partial [Lactarius quietus]